MYLGDEAVDELNDPSDIPSVHKKTAPVSGAVWFDRMRTCSERRPEVVQLAGRSEQDIAAGNELRVFGDEDLSGWAEVELLRVGLEELAVNPGPHQAAIGVDIDLSNAFLGGREVFVYVDAHRAGDFTASSVDASHFVLRDGRGAMHDKREVG